MSSEARGAIRVEHLCKSFKHYAKPTDWLKEKLFKRPYAQERNVLDNINFSLKPGEALGIIGRNGAGKSTLLQLITGTLTPSSGHVVKTGRVAALLELGAGFNPDFSGRENARLNAALMGLTPQEISEKLPAIFEFSGIGEALDRPVRTYSSGMIVRLAFSVATAVEPDILIIDEALSVGDGAFARKSFERIKSLLERGCTLLFCSHSLYQIEKLCQRILWVEGGEAVLYDRPELAVQKYQMFLDDMNQIRPSDSIPETTIEPATNLEANDSKSDGIEIGRSYIKSVRVNGLAPPQTALDVVSEQTNLSVEIEYQAGSGAAVPLPAITFQLANNTMITSTGAWFSVPVSGVLIHNQTYQATAYFPRIPLLRGEYTLSVYLMEPSGTDVLDTAERFLTLDVRDSTKAAGYFAIPHEWQLRER